MINQEKTNLNCWEGGGAFCGVDCCVQIEGNIPGARAVCLFFFLSVCCPGVMPLVYCNMLIPFKCLKTKLTIFILLLCVFLLSSLIFLFISLLFSI